MGSLPRATSVNHLDQLDFTQLHTTVLITQHGQRVPPAYVTIFLDSHMIPYYILQLTDSDNAEQNRQLLRKLVGTNPRALISLGGAMGAYETTEHPWILDEQALLADLTHRNIPVLGICLGAQMAAAALGGECMPSKTFEVGYVPLTPTVDALDDPVMSHFFVTDSRSKSPAEETKTLEESKTNERIAAHTSAHSDPHLPLLMHHGDTYSNPSGSVALAVSSTNQLNAAFKVNNTYAVQFHPESGLSELHLWSAFAYPKYKTIGLTADDVVTAAEGHQTAATKATKLFFDKWWEFVLVVEAKR